MEGPPLPSEYDLALTNADTLAAEVQRVATARDPQRGTIRHIMGGPRSHLPPLSNKASTNNTTNDKRSDPTRGGITRRHSVW